MFGILTNLWNNIYSTISNYTAKYEVAAMFLVIFVLFLKLFVNNAPGEIDRKKMIVRFPGEITLLVLGFLISDIIAASNKVLENETPNTINLSNIIIVLIILVIQYALERFLDDKLSGKLELKMKASVGFMYIISGMLYISVIYGG